MFQDGKEVIVLAGGLGTRLRKSIGDMPKCMAPVNGRPFLHYLFQYLVDQHVESVVLSLGYKHEVVVGWLHEHHWPFKVTWVIESEPLGTGGGIRLALDQCEASHVVVLNGDTMFQVSLEDLYEEHNDHQAEVTIALKPMEEFDRYGTVVTDESGRVLQFCEKASTKRGLINGGIYLIAREVFLTRQLPTAFSFERDYLEKLVEEARFYAYTSDAYFIDIGVPDDYELAQTQFQQLFQ